MTGLLELDTIYAQHDKNVDSYGGFNKSIPLQFYCDLLEPYLISNWRNFPIFYSLWKVRELTSV